MRGLIVAGVVCLAGCATNSVRTNFDCSDDALAQWQIPAGWMDHELTPAQASAEVATANVVRDAAEARWKALRDTWREGDAYWLYRRPETDAINPLGAQRGVVLLRGCEQLGFVTTRIAEEREAPVR